MTTRVSVYGVRCRAAKTSSWGGYTGWCSRSRRTNACSSGQYGLSNSPRSTGFQSVTTSSVSHATYHPPMSLICVVTGANSGIGRATAIHIAREGHTVYGTVRDVERAGKLLSMATDAGVEVNLIELDVADDD